MELRGDKAGDGGEYCIWEEKGGRATISSSRLVNGEKFMATLVIINRGMFNFHVLVVVKW